MKQKIVFSTNFKRNYVACFAVVLFLFIVMGEILLAVAIPAYMNRENAMALQVNKLRFLNNFDGTRSRCERISGKDETLLLEKKLLASALDEMAVILRKESDNLTMEEIDHLNQVITNASHVAAKMQKGQPFSKINQVQTNAYVRTILKQNKAGASHETK